MFFPIIFISFWFVMLVLGLVALYSNNGKTEASASRTAVGGIFIAIILDLLWAFLMLIRISPTGRYMRQEAWDQIFWNFTVPWIGPQFLIAIGAGIYVSQMVKKTWGPKNQSPPNP